MSLLVALAPEKRLAPEYEFFLNVVGYGQGMRTRRGSDYKKVVRGVRKQREVE